MSIRFIKSLKNKVLSKDFINSAEWDVIELPWIINLTELKRWYKQIDSTYNHLYFDFRNESVLKEKYHLKNIETAFLGSIGDQNKEIYDEGYHIISYIKKQRKSLGEILRMVLSWGVEKDIPIPPKWAAKESLFPELNLDLPRKIQKKFRVGYLNNIIRILGEDIINDVAIIKHTPGAKLEKHIDGPNIQRLHIPIISDKDAKFLYGEKLETEYNLEIGKVYLINASIPHGTIHKGVNERVHLQTKPNMDRLLSIYSDNILI
jgi:hypothetical protein